jgi:2-polyprenyl-3-methyl-5-hydroxy-6-metoxy-1,4-benzoquinol methylase
MVNKIKYYEDKNTDYFISDRSDVLNFCRNYNIDFTNKKILEIGCGSGLTLKKISDTFNNVEVTGVDLYAENTVNGINVIKDSLENFLTNNKLDDFDFIFILDVLEHLIDPWETLQKINDNILNNTKLIVSLPNVSDFIFIKKLLFENKFEYTSKGGIFDQTHLRFFTIIDMRKMFKISKFEILYESQNYLHNKSIRKILHYITFGFLSRFYTLQYFFIIHKKTND